MCKYLSPTFKLRVSHLRLVYSYSKQFQTVCPLLNCGLLFSTFCSYNSHVYRHHRTEIGIFLSESPFLPPQEVGQRSSEIPGSSGSHESDDDLQDNSSQVLIDTSVQKIY